MSSVSGLNASHPQPSRPQDGLPHAPLQRDCPVSIGREAKFQQVVAIFCQLVAKSKQFVGKNLILVDKLCRSLKNSNQDEGGVIVFGIDEKRISRSSACMTPKTSRKKSTSKARKKGTGQIKGSFVRVGDADEPMSEYEVYSYEAYRKHIRLSQSAKSS